MKNLNFGKDTINIFTDASVKKIDTSTVGVSSVYVYRGTDILVSSSRTISEPTIIEAELYSIYLAIQEVAKLADESVKYINIYTDSKGAKEILTNSVFKWVANCYDGKVIHKSADKELSYSDLLFNILHAITWNDLELHIYHIGAHTPMSSFTKYKDDVKEKFKLINKLDTDVSDQFIKNLCIGNHMADSLCSYIMRTTSDVKDQRHLNPHIYKYDIDMLKYTNCIR